MERAGIVPDSPRDSLGTGSCDVDPMRKLELDWKSWVLGQWTGFGVHLFQLFLLADDKLPWEEASGDSTLPVAKPGLEFTSKICACDFGMFSFGAQHFNSMPLDYSVFTGVEGAEGFLKEKKQKGEHDLQERHLKEYVCDFFLKKSHWTFTVTVSSRKQKSPPAPSLQRMGIPAHGFLCWPVFPRCHTVWKFSNQP